MLPRKSVFNICFLYTRSLGTDRPSHSLILHLPQVLKGQICPSLDAGLDSNLALLDLFTTVMFSSYFGVRHYPKISINEENRKASWRRAGSASRHLHSLLFRLIFYQAKTDFSLWHSWQKTSPPQNWWVMVKLGISVDPNILLLLKRSVL